MAWTKSDFYDAVYTYNADPARCETAEEAQELLNDVETYGVDEWVLSEIEEDSAEMDKYITMARTLSFDEDDLPSTIYECGCNGGLCFVLNGDY